MRSVTQFAIRMLDRLTAALPKRESDTLPKHLIVGQRGEEAAYFWLRQHGYTIVARNWRSPHARGELDLIGWEEGELCFIEVKTRSSKGIVPAEMAVTRDKQYELIGMARLYMRRMPRETVSRFDVVSVYLCEDCDPEIQLIRNAFGWSFKQ
ncbi:MAG TPA: YraN family protein [Clostridia bacterium]|nr:YraN family protein [Clostridia bacterium]